MKADCVSINLQSGIFSGHFSADKLYRHPAGHCVYFDGTLLNRHELAEQYALPDDGSDAVLVGELLAHATLNSILLRLNGPFLLAFYTPNTRHLAIARDHLGQRQCFYAMSPDCGTIYFGTSIPALRQQITADGQTTAIDHEAVAEYFRLGYISGRRTVYSEISRIPPATHIVFSLTTPPSPTRYWQPQFSPAATVPPAAAAEAAEKGRELIRRSIRRLIERHPGAGYMLSGGIDSGTVAGLTEEFFPATTPRSACTISLPGSSYDESALAAGTAARCGLNLNCCELHPEDIDNIEALIADAGEPFADSSLLPTWRACRENPHGALFTGDGGDELFGGYRRYQAMLIRGALPAALDTLCRPLAWCLNAVLPDGANSRSRLSTLKRTAYAMSLPRLHAYSTFQAVAPWSLTKRLLNFTVDTNPPVDDWAQHYLPCGSTLFQECNALDLAFYLPDDGFRKTAIAAEASQVTLLSPLLDLDVVQFALGLPTPLRLTRHANKIILRSIGSRYLDPRILCTPKRGFGLPVADWFRGPLAERIRELGEDAATWDRTGLLNPRTVRKIAANHLSGRADHAALLWALWCYRLWQRS